MKNLTAKEAKDPEKLTVSVLASVLRKLRLAAKNKNRVSIYIY